MKSIKFILLSLTFMLGFILQCEVFQTELWNFDQSYYMSSSYNVPTDQIKEFLSDLSNTAEQYDVHVFSTIMSEQSSYEMILNIYGDGEAVRQTLADKNSIQEKTYHSLFNGITSISYHPLADLCDSDLSYHNYVSYIGDSANIQKVYDDIQQKYDVTMPEYLQATEEDVIVVVWLLMAVLMLVMNGVDVIRRKKEVVVRISLGESVVRIIVRSVVVDLLVDGVAYLLARTFVFRFMSGEYQWRLAFAIFVIGCILSSCVYFTFAVYDIKKAFSNVNDSKSVLYVMYGLKVVVTLLTIVTITANLSNLQSNMLVKSDDMILSQYGEYSYFTFRDLSAMGYGLSEGDWEQRENMEAEVCQEIFELYYDKITPVICVNILEGQSDYIFVNKNAEGMLQGFQDLLVDEAKDSDMVVFIPKRMDQEAAKLDVAENLESFIMTDNQSLHVHYITYDTRETFAYMSDQAACGIASTVNPVIIYQNQEDVPLNGETLINFAGNEIMYRITDATVQEIDQKYELTTHGVDLVRTNVQEYYQYRKNFVTRLVSFLSSLCVVMFLLQLIIIVTMNALEYRLHALELSLKKILGYSLWTKNRKSIIFSAGVDVVVAVVCCIVGYFMYQFDIPLCLLTGLLIAAVELSVVIWNIFWLEKGSVHKALKGGCL